MIDPVGALIIGIIAGAITAMAASMVTAYIIIAGLSEAGVL